MQEHFDAFAPGAANHVPLSPVSFLKRAAVVHPDHVATVQQANGVIPFIHSGNHGGAG